jgi:hypothetical protein
MLDIYFIDRGAREIPDTPDESRIIGSIDLDQHKSLRKLFDLCEMKRIRFSYFEDSLLNEDQINEMWKIFNGNFHLIENNRDAQKAYQRFEEILLFAIERKVGLVSYCD